MIVVAPRDQRLSQTSSGNLAAEGSYHRDPQPLIVQRKREYAVLAMNDTPVLRFSLIIYITLFLLIKFSYQNNYLI